MTCQSIERRNKLTCRKEMPYLLLTWLMSALESTRLPQDPLPPIIEESVSFSTIGFPRLRLNLYTQVNKHPAQGEWFQNALSRPTCSLKRRLLWFQSTFAR